MEKQNIILINIPFTNLSEKKLRPALIIGKIQDDFLCCFISSNIKAKTKHDVLIKKNPKNNLKIDSVIKCGKLFTLHNSLIERKIGIIDSNIYNDAIRKIIEIIK